MRRVMSAVRPFAWLAAGGLLAALAAATSAQDTVSAADAATSADDVLAAPRVDEAGVLRPARWLTLEAVDETGRRPFRPDAVVARFLLDPSAAPPRAGETLIGERGEEQAWTARDARDDGGPGGGVAWAYAALDGDGARVLLLHLAGASTAWVNGEPFVGDVYRFGVDGVPVALRVGRNDVYVTGIRGAFALDFVPVVDALVLSSREVTAPDLVQGASDVGPAGVLALATSTRRIASLRLVCAGDALFRPLDLTLPGLPPLGVRQLGVPLALREGVRVPDDADRWTLPIEVRATFGDAGSDVPHAANGAAEIAVARFDLVLRVVPPDVPRRVTFVSQIDGSVQFYALRPPQGAPEADTAPRTPHLVLSLHGAGVDALAQARCYAPRPDRWIVAPTNRRPFGFDWQDWGRADAYEALADALPRTGVDRHRVALAGHSMGGHGAWHLAANDADGFSAVAPSAGWMGFDSYGGRPEGELAALWQAADGPSRTLDLIDDLAQMPVFVLHGEADDNVPPSEAELMLSALRDAGAQPLSHFQPGAGHWWDGDASPGTDCLDWPEMVELLAASSIPDDPDALAFTTWGPGVDARHHWVSVEQVLHPGAVAHVEGAWDASGAASLSTTNVRRLALAPRAGTRAAVARTRRRGRASRGGAGRRVACVRARRVGMARGRTAARGRDASRSLRTVQARVRPALRARARDVRHARRDGDARGPRALRRAGLAVPRQRTGRDRVRRRVPRRRLRGTRRDPVRQRRHERRLGARGRGRRAAARRAGRDHAGRTHVRGRRPGRAVRPSAGRRRRRARGRAGRQRRARRAHGLRAAALRLGGRIHRLDRVERLDPRDGRRRRARRGLVRRVLGGGRGVRARVGRSSARGARGMLGTHHVPHPEGPAMFRSALISIVLFAPFAASQQVLDVSTHELAPGLEVVVSVADMGPKTPRVRLVPEQGKARKLKVVAHDDGSVTALLRRAPAGSYALEVRPRGLGGAAPVIWDGPVDVRLPQLLGVVPSTVEPGGCVFLTGKWFGTIKGRVRVGGKRVSIASWGPLDAPLADGSTDLVTICLPKSLGEGTWDVDVWTRAGKVTFPGAVTVALPDGDPGDGDGPPVKTGKVIMTADLDGDAWTSDHKSVRYEVATLDGEPVTEVLAVKGDGPEFFRFTLPFGAQFKDTGTFSGDDLLRFRFQVGLGDDALVYERVHPGDATVEIVSTKQGKKAKLSGLVDGTLRRLDADGHPTGPLLEVTDGMFTAEIGDIDALLD